MIVWRIEKIIRTVFSAVLCTIATLSRVVLPHHPGPASSDSHVFTGSRYASGFNTKFLFQSKSYQSIISPYVAWLLQGWNCYITQFDSLEQRSDDEIWIRLAEEPWLEVPTEWRQRLSWRRLLWHFTTPEYNFTGWAHKKWSSYAILPVPLLHTLWHTAPPIDVFDIYLDVVLPLQWIWGYFTIKHAIQITCLHT